MEDKKIRRNIKNVIAIMSGKGGVGKSTLTTLIAKELTKKGHKVGILDADITGPSIPRLMGIKDEKISSDGEFFYPILTKDKIKVVSLNLMLPNEDEAVVWRGPVIAQAVMQFWNEVAWEDLDFLLVDMPPGTGDVPLTIMKNLDIKGVVIISTPQDMVSMIVGKAVNMARKMNIKILGIIENMSYILCDECEHKIFLFGENDSKNFLEKYNLNLLAELPMTREIANLSKGENSYPRDIISSITEKIILNIE